MDISDQLLAEAKVRAAQEHTTLRDLVDRGLRLVVHGRTSPERFQLADASVDGDGLSPEFEGAGWDTIREALYEPDRP